MLKLHAAGSVRSLENRCHGPVSKPRATDNTLADVRSRGHFMGEEFETIQAPRIEVALLGTAEFETVSIIKNGRHVRSANPGTR